MVNKLKLEDRLEGETNL
jgi:hypothetical protein